jgi:hypothetical protein
MRWVSFWAPSSVVLLSPGSMKFKQKLRPKPSTLLPDVGLRGFIIGVVGSLVCIHGVSWMFPIRSQTHVIPSRQLPRGGGARRIGGHADFPPALAVLLQRASHIAPAIYASALALQQIVGWPVWACVTVVGALTTLYTVFGGMKQCCGPMSCSSSRTENLISCEALYIVESREAHARNSQGRRS